MSNHQMQAGSGEIASFDIAADFSIQKGDIFTVAGIYEGRYVRIRQWLALHCSWLGIKAPKLITWTVL